VRTRSTLVTLALAAVLAVPATASAQEHTLGPASEAPASDHTLGPAPEQALHRGFLVPSQAEYAKAKREAGGRHQTETVDEGPLAPTIARGWNGLFDASRAPSDSTSSVGTTRFIEIVNSKFGIYNKTSSTPTATGLLSVLAGFDGNVFDPQIMWDGQTNRFYYAMDMVISESDNRLAFGFSKTASPSSAADFCQYWITYGAKFPDYPKLGDTQNFMLFGYNSYDAAGAFSGSEMAWVTKPAAGTTCPDASTFKFGIQASLRDASGAGTFTPVPANQLDPSTTGYAVARTLSLPSTRMMVHTITRNTDGTANINPVARAVTVPSYTVPANAKQKSPSTKVLDTSDARPTQAVQAIDPARGGGAGVALWTQHTTLGGAGAEVRWYEIRPGVTPATLWQSGKATSPSYFAFNGAISPDRVVNGTTRAFGQSMVLGFDTSSTTTFPAVRQISKVGTAAASAHQLVHASPGNYFGFDCAGADNDCRWGDYAGASPDPVKASADATRGRIWSTSQFASGATSTAQANWRSWNWIATP
jgi:hypothetical protein